MCTGHRRWGPVGGGLHLQQNQSLDFLPQLLIYQAGEYNK